MRRATVVYLVLLLGLAGVYYYLNHREQPADIAVTLEPESQVSYLFTAEDGVPTSIHVEAKDGATAEVARDADKAWALTLPVEAKADQAAAEAVATQVTTLRILDTVPDLDPEIAGLTSPEYTLSVRFTSGVERKAEIGVITPTETGYYVRNADGGIVIVSKSSLDSVIGLLANPPYLETPLPSTPEAGTPSAQTSTPAP
jgi:hypothetical protein